MQTTAPTTDPIKSIPEPDVVRARLAERMREVAVLKQLLKLSERAAKDRRQLAEAAAR